MTNSNYLFVLFFTFIFCGTSMAQIQKNSVRLGGDLSFDRIVLNDDGLESSHSVFQIQVGPSYFVTKGLALGIDVGFTSSNLKIESSAINLESSSNGVRFGPSLSYFIPTGSSKFYIPIQVMGGYQSISSTDDQEESSESAYYYGGNIGLEFIPAKALGLRLSFGPVITNEIEEENQTDQANPINWQVRLGAAYYFYKEKE